MFVKLSCPVNKEYYLVQIHFYGISIMFFVMANNIILLLLCILK